MTRKTIILIVIAAVLVIAGGWYLYSEYFTGSKVPASENEDSDQIIENNKPVNNFSKVGNLTSATADETQNQWLLVYEESNKPALNSKLVFNDKSVCDYGSGDVPCSGVKLNDGDMVKVEGNLKDGKVIVFRMELIPVHDEGDAARVCIQVITSAKNPATGEIKDFPTPCDVPDGWVPVNESSY